MKKILIILSILLLASSAFGGNFSTDDHSQSTITAIGNSGAASNISMANPVSSITISENTTLTITNLPSAGKWKQVKLKVTSASAFTIAWAVSGGVIKWPLGVSVDAATVGTDYFLIWCDDATNVNIVRGSEDSQ